ncbi:MAG: hypothetical protein AAF226_06370, partial [Verrucomicrobiota bacterium]
SIHTWLWNPFQKIAGQAALVLGVILVLLTSWIGSLSSTHFDGVLDTHFGAAVPLWFFLAEGMINWLSMAIMLWVVALVIGKAGKFRLIDLFGTQALARWPFMVTALAALTPGYRRAAIELEKIDPNTMAIPPVEPADAVAFGVIAIVMLVMLVWFCWLAWKSFRVSCDAKGKSAIGGFFVALIVAEIISKVAITALTKLL